MKQGENVVDVPRRDLLSIEKFLKQNGLTFADLGVDEKFFENGLRRNWLDREEWEIFSSQTIVDPRRKLDKGKSYHHTFNESIYNGELIHRGLLQIDKDLFAEIFEVLSKAERKFFEDGLRRMIYYSNHNFTMHQAGIVGGSKTDSFLRFNVFPFSPIGMEKIAGVPDNTYSYQTPEPEFYALIFHRLMFEKIFSKKPLLKEKFVRVVSFLLLMLKKKLPNESFKRWEALIKYLFVAIINPNDDVLKKYGINFRLGKVLTEFSAVVHSDKFILKPSLIERYNSFGKEKYDPHMARYISARDLLESVYLKAEDPDVDRDNIVLSIVERSLPVIKKDGSELNLFK